MNYLFGDSIYTPFYLKLRVRCIILVSYYFQFIYTLIWYISSQNGVQSNPCLTFLHVYDVINLYSHEHNQEVSSIILWTHQYYYLSQSGPGWLNELGCWITLQLIQMYKLKPITNTHYAVWVCALLCKLQKRVHLTRSRKWQCLPIACPWSVVLSVYSGFFHH